jgi:hypothetical protein
MSELLPRAKLLLGDLVNGLKGKILMVNPGAFEQVSMTEVGQRKTLSQPLFRCVWPVRLF